MRRALTLGLVLLATAASASDLSPSREDLSPQTQWAPSGNFPALHTRAVFRGETGSGTRPYAREEGGTAAGAGIFLSRDSFEGSPNSAPSLHRFAYGNSNPLRYTDPDGRRAEDEVEAAKLAELRALAAQLEKSATVGYRLEALLAKGSPFAPPRDARALRKYADRWSTAIGKAGPHEVVVIRESSRSESAEWVNGLFVADFHLRMKDARGTEFVLDTAASFETAAEYEAKNRDLAFISALENGPNSSAFNRLVSTLPGGALPGLSGSPKMSSRSPGLPPGRLQRSGGTRWGQGTASESAKWNVREKQFDPSTGRLRDESGHFVKDPENPASPNKMTDAERRAAWRDLASDPSSQLTPA